MATKHSNILKGSWRNIRNVYESASEAAKSEGEVWYSQAHVIAKALGAHTGLPLEKQVKAGAGILAALSPQTDWGTNITFAWLLVLEGTQKHTTANHNKAMRILNGEEPLDVLGGNKVRAFYGNILNPEDATVPVTIDRHAVAVYLGRVPEQHAEKAYSNKQVWKRIEGAYRQAARHLNINPQVLQAVTWVEWRYRKGIASTVNSAA